MKKAVKRGLTQRLMERVGMGDSSDEEDAGDAREKDKDRDSVKVKEDSDGEATLKGNGVWEKDFASTGTNRAQRGRGRKRLPGDLEMGSIRSASGDGVGQDDGRRRPSFQLPVPSMSMLEQSMPADAVLAKEGAEEVRGAYS